jgi:ParB-like chromosome segregation protein Spo0J
VALQKAPAGIVLLAEGWALSPRQVEQTLKRVLPHVENRRLVLLVANHDGQGHPLPPTETERGEWEKLVDRLREVELELVFFEEAGR